MCTNISWHLSGPQEACSGAARAGLSGPGQVKAGAGQAEGLRPMGRAWCRGRSTPRVGPAVMEGSHMSEGGGRGSEQRPRLPHALPLASLPCPAPALPPTPPRHTCSAHHLQFIPSGNCGCGRPPLLPQGLVSSHLCPQPGCWNPGPRGRKGAGGTVRSGLGKAPGRLCVPREGPSSWFPMHLSRVFELPEGDRGHERRATPWSEPSCIFRQESLFLTWTVIPQRCLNSWARGQAPGPTCV